MARNGAQREDKQAAEAQLNRAKGAVAEVEAYVKETYLISSDRRRNFRAVSEGRRIGRYRGTGDGYFGFIGHVGIF